MQRKFLAFVLILIILASVAAVSAQEPAPPEGDRLNIVLDSIAAATGLERGEIVRLMREDGKTLADIITENGGDVSAVQTELVAALTSDFSANIEQNVTDILNNPLPRGGEARPGEDRLDNPLVNAIIGEMVAAGATAQEIREQAEAGLPLSDIAASAGIDTTTITETIKSSAAERLAEQVANGELTQAEADERLANLDGLLEAALNTPLPELQRQARFNEQVSRALVISAVQALGGDERSIREQLQEGDTWAGFITTQGGDVDAISADAKAKVEEGLAKLVSDGNLSQEEADILLATLDETITDILNREIRAPQNPPRR